MTSAVTSAMTLAQNGPGAPHIAIAGADTSGKIAPPKNRNAENDDDAILRGKVVAFSAASVKRVLAVPWSPPRIIMLVTTTAILCEIGRAHVLTPVTWPSRMPSSA